VGTHSQEQVITVTIDKNVDPLWLIIQDVMRITFWIFCILWHIFLITLFLDIKISGSTLVFIPCIVLVAMIILVAVFARLEALEAKKEEKTNGITIFQKYTTFKLDILNGLGRLFRTIFISFVGIAGYHWIDPQPIGDTPFPDLTLRQFFGNLFALLLGLGCIVWFFKFPKNKNPMSEDPIRKPYLSWGCFGIFLVLLVIIVGAYGGMLFTKSIR